MSYLLIKEEDAKTFKSFMSGNEIEVGVFVDPRNKVFDKGSEIEIFYGDESTDTYKAEIRRREMCPSPAGKSGRSLVRLSLIRK